MFEFKLQFYLDLVLKLFIHKDCINANCQLKFLATSLSRWPLRLLVSRVWSLLNIHVISSYCRLLPCNAREKISLIGCAGHSECIGQSMRENFSRMMPIGSIHTIAFIQWAVFLIYKSHM